MFKKILILAFFSTLSPIAMAADKEDIMAIDRAFSQMSSDKGILAAFDHYLADDATKLDGGAHAVKGHDTILADMRGIPAGATLAWEPQDGMVASSGDLAYTWGTYVYKGERDGKPQVGYGKYVTIWAKRDGEWKAILDGGNSSPGPMPE